MRVDKQNLNSLDWAKMDNLVPCVVQHVLTGEVLMLGYMNDKALEKTLESGQVTFYSRSKERLWTKGESSGHVLELEEVHTDCDSDALLIKATPNGPTCHLGTQSCFADTSGSFLHHLEGVINSRKGADAGESYTASLFQKGIKRCAQKVGEEGVEVALAAATNDKDELLNESADLLYHLLVVLSASELSMSDVLKVLKQRHN
ncbi:bifunctional phosphoribosyl-AMP cyclohydrolase/phosphoribosyl-ATP diphosphatase HisIE [Idiomarina sp. UBA4520]|uniref:bifunctional phosphoribosyl-AMP cyclohydrolase/phosphoribosyl-ATP diphosphatase HisIE n=1 Tax=Idiomarina sp. UBA4520 TaxID=1946647 RepID=UPI000A9E15C9|nr:bifunctional phosphoribosyl-AMP cyclohydrolase/phosphoribosyl-ATP diphosphatase HisIE [Idiomarina sp. UBA4520]MBF37857.1 bifunctional phosphoribosyl-AMP cyclohydrolase/phosphoribosyl-ATP diphosphatase [Idiomarinaceae bacterium]